MSKSIEKEISCPSCRKATVTRLWPSIDCSDHPEQRERILEESLFTWECPNCSYKMQLVYPCLYYDKDHRLLVLLDPNQQEQSLNKRELEAEKLSGTAKRIVATPEELKEKLLIFGAGLSDAVCELCKLAMWQSVAKRQGMEPTGGYFSQVNPNKNEITFVFTFAHREPLYDITRFDVYRKAEEVTTALHFDPYGKEFLRIDREMAKLMLEEFQNS